MVGGHGGARPGAGRKPKAKRYPDVAERVEGKIIDNMDDIVNVLVERAVRRGDVNACKYLLERVLGKLPPAEAELSTDGHNEPDGPEEQDGQDEASQPPP